MIPTLLAKLERGDIQIPEIQRGFVWKPSQIETLADSIYKDYPIGMLTLYPPPRELGGKEGIYWVLDGQQRLLSLSLIMKGSVDLGGGRLRQMKVWFDPETEKFSCKESGTPRGDKWIEISEIFAIKSRLELEGYLSSLTLATKEKERISALWESLQHYAIPYRDVGPSADIDTLGDIFVRTNYAGTRVRGADIFSTMIAVVRSGTAKDLKEFTRGLRMGWNDIDYSVPIKTFIAFLTDGKVKLASRVLDQANKLKAVLSKKKDEIPEIVELTKKNLQNAIDLLEHDWLGIYSPDYDLLPYDNLLVTLSYYLGKKKKLLSNEINGLLSWYVLAAYFERYSTSSEARLNEDLSIIAEGKGYEELIDKLEEREGGDLKTSIKTDISNGHYSKLLLYVLLRRNQSCDLISDGLLDSRDVSLHHIFPSGVLTENEDDIRNLTLTTLGTNNRLRATKPRDYLSGLSPDTRKQHFIPQDPRLWEINKYDEFLEKRGELLRQAVEDLLVF